MKNRDYLSNDYRAVRLTAALNRRGITLEQFAARLGKTVQQVERKIKNWSWRATEVFDVSDAINVSVSTAAALIIEPAKEGTLTFDGMPYFTKPMNYEKITVLDDGTRVRQTVRVDYEIL